MRTQKQNTNKQSTLYSVVFESRSVKFAVFMVFVFLLIQPVAPVFAALDESIESSEVSTEVIESVPEIVAIDDELVASVDEEENVTDDSPVEEIDATAGINTEQTDDENSETVEVDQGVAGSVPVVQESSLPVVEKSTSTSVAGSVNSSTSSDEYATQETIADTNSSVNEQSSATGTVSTTTSTVVHASSTDVGLSTSTPQVNPQEEGITEGDIDEVLPEVVDEQVDENEVTDFEETTEESVVDTVSVAPIVNTEVSDANRYQFSTNECVSVGDGSYYCNSQSSGVTRPSDSVFAQQDEEDGDLEIFMRRNGVTTQITHNTYDDAAPHFDVSTNEIVFHRLIKGRYQIIRYSVDTSVEEQLTDSHENNMEPVQVNGVMVWQVWVVDNWEIALLQDGEIRVVTHNTQHDIAPTIRDGYIMWHTISASGEKLLSVYDINSGESSTIADPDGGHVENPRFVLVYDTLFENGDLVTKEYDPKTGEIRPIGTEPAPLPPTEIPTPDPTGETRALVNSKSATRGETVENFDDEISSDDTNGTTTPNAAVETNSESIEVATSTSSSTTLSLDLSATSSDVLPLDEYDLIIEPFTSTTSASEIGGEQATGTSQAISI